jgi:hypothetical protein
MIIEICVASACYLLLLVQTPEALPGPAKAKDRTEYLAGCLDNPVAEIDKGEVALPFLLDTVSSLASPPGFDKNPSLKATILIDVEFFKREKGDFDPERVQIKFQNKLVGVSLRTVLQLICEQNDAGFVVRKDFIEILPAETLRKELNYPQGTVRDFCSLVVCNCEKIPLEKALNDLAKLHNRTVVLSPQAEKELSQPISARLINVPFDVAVESLADMAGLKLVRKSNVLLVTTKKQAAELKAAQDQGPKAKKPNRKPANEKVETPPGTEKK